MNKKGKIIIIIVVLLIGIIYMAVALTFSGKSVVSTFSPTYLIVGNNFAWQKDKDNWINVTDINKLQGIKFNIYYDSKNNNTGYINTSGSITYVKEVGQKDFKEKNFRAAISNGTIELADYNIEDVAVESDYYASMALSEINENILPSFEGKRISMDLDNNGSIDTLYFVSNISLENTSGFLTKVFVVENSEIKELIIESGIYRYEIIEILDLDKDGNYEIILAKKKKGMDSYETCFELYSLKDGKYKVTKECEL